MRRILLLALLLSGCRPLPPTPPPDGPGDCDTATANLTILGGCGLDMAAFPAQCRGASAAEVDIGERYPVGCVTAAKTCEEAWSCR